MVVPETQLTAEEKVLQKKVFVRLLVEKKEGNSIFTGWELCSSMWWAKHGMVVSDAEELFSEKNSHPPPPTSHGTGSWEQRMLRR